MTRARPRTPASRNGWLIALILPLSGCDLQPWLPQGPVAAQQWQLMQDTVLLMLLVLVPVFVMVVWIPWHYRAGNKRARYAPGWKNSRTLDLMVWLGPSAIVVALGMLAWQGTHRLDPYRPLSGDGEPLQVQVVALDWNWLFIYPEQHVATINHLVIPAGRPVAFDITSATVMDAFFIPRLGSQIYAMPGMTTRLHLLADHPGHYVGRNTQYSGRGFPEQRFGVDAEPAPAFDAWVTRQQADAAPLDDQTLAALLEPHEGHPAETYGQVPEDLFARLRNRFKQSTGHHE